MTKMAVQISGYIWPLWYGSLVQLGGPHGCRSGCDDVPLSWVVNPQVFNRHTELNSILSLFKNRKEQKAIYFLVMGSHYPN